MSCGVTLPKCIIRQPSNLKTEWMFDLGHQSEATSRKQKGAMTKLSFQNKVPPRLRISSPLVVAKPSIKPDIFKHFQN